MAAKKTGHMVFHAGPLDHDARNAEMAALKADIAAEEAAEGRVFEERRFRATIDDHMLFVEWSYRPRINGAA